MKESTLLPMWIFQALFCEDHWYLTSRRKLHGNGVSCLVLAFVGVSANISTDGVLILEAI